MSYIRRLKIHNLVETKLVNGVHFIERTPVVGIFLAGEFLSLVDSQWIKKGSPKTKDNPRGREYIFLTEKAIRLCEEVEEVLLRIEPKLEEENYL